MEAPEFFQGNYAHTAPAAEPKSVDPFMVEDLLDFSCGDDDAMGEAPLIAGSATVSPSTDAVVDSYSSTQFAGPAADSSCRNFGDSGELSVPFDDLAELEWLSNFVEESFSSEDLQKPELTSAMKCTSAEDAGQLGDLHADTSSPKFHPAAGVPAKARSKRSRAAHCNWSSRILVECSDGPESSSDKKTGRLVRGQGVEGRKCMHCATDKTPQWRTGPMGPKTLCNACGVRYKSGRLVPEYRPAASPTFVLTKHSNSHRKVLELRRQKELDRGHQQQQHNQQQNQFFHQNMVFGAPNGDDYLIYQHMGPDFTHII